MKNLSAIDEAKDLITKEWLESSSNNLALQAKTLHVGGNASLEGETLADSIIAGSLLVNGDARFVNTIQGNVATATKLATSRLFWGQSFDGSGNITGNMSSVGSISMNGAFSGATTGSFSSNVTVGGTLGVTGAATFGTGVNLTEEKYIQFRGAHTSYYTTLRYDTSSNEALILGMKNSVTSFIIKSGDSGTTATSTTAWQSISAPSLQVKGQSVYINELIANGATGAYNLKVNGTAFTKDLTISNGSKSVTLSVDSDGNLKFDGNIYATGFVSAGGVSSTAAGGGGLDWTELTTAGTQVIHVSHIPNLSIAKIGDIASASVDNAAKLGGVAASSYVTKTYKGAIIPLEENGTTTAGSWLAKSDLVTALEDGRMYLYRVAVAGASTTYLTINSLTRKTIYRTGTTKLTTHYPVGEWLLLVYNATRDAFDVVNDYDANSYAYARQYVTANTDANTYPLLFMYDTTKASAGSYVTKYTRYADTIYANASDGSLTASKFIVKDGTSSQFLKADGSVDSNTYLTSHQSLAGYATQTWVENKGYTTNTGTVTSVAVKMNNTVKGTITSSGTIDLGTVITSHQDISGKLDKTGGTVTGTIFSKNESNDGVISYWVPWYTSSYSGGWARTLLGFKSRDGSTYLGGWGALGSGASLTYFYIGWNSYDSANNLRLYSDKVTWGGNTIYHTGNLPAYPTSLPASDVSAWAKKSSLEASDVPSLAASKITSGTFDAARIPSLAISKITNLQTTLDGKQGTISDLATIRSNASNGNIAYGWGNHANAGYQLASTAITTSNIGSQNVSYATSAGHLQDKVWRGDNNNGDGNPFVGYKKLATLQCSVWLIVNTTFAVHSRHCGTLRYSLSLRLNDSYASYDCSVKAFGVTTESNQLRFFYNTSTGVFTIWKQFHDYDYTYVTTEYSTWLSFNGDDTQYSDIPAGQGTEIGVGVNVATSLSGGSVSATSGSFSDDVYIGTSSTDKTLSVRYITGHGSSNLSLCPWGGNVGIGTTSPSAKLEVNGVSRSQYHEFIARDGSGAGYIGRGASSNDDIYIHTGNGNIRFITTSDAHDRLCITNAGNVGIGTIFPYSTLHVNGRIAVNGSEILNWASANGLAQTSELSWYGMSKYDCADGTGGWGLRIANFFGMQYCVGGNYQHYFEGRITCSSEITAYSDRRLKGNIQDLSFRGRLAPKSYIKDGKECIGFIAQEVREKYPELVLGEETDKSYLSLNYGAISAVLAAQLNNTDDKVAILEKEVATLKAKIKELEER